METVEVVIRLPEKTYRKILSNEYDYGDMNAIIQAGSPLPKGHGRLFILDEAKAKEYFTNFSFSLQDWISEVGISNATLKVIEVDKEVQDE